MPEKDSNDNRHIMGLFVAAKKNPATDDSMWFMAMNADDGKIIGSSGCVNAKPSLKITAKKKCNAVMKGMRLRTANNPCTALCVVMPAVLGCSSVLPLKGACKIETPGNPPVVFACSGLGKPEVDEMVMEDALEKGGYAEDDDGVWRKH